MTDSDRTTRLQQEILQNPAYKLAYEDADLLAKDDLRAVRLQLELLKPERALHDHGIDSTVVVFDSARTRSSEETQKQLTRAEQACAENPGSASAKMQLETANRGAFDVDARSIGLNITLPHEQKPNPFITPDLAFRFHYFAIRKMHFLMRAKALVAFPRGFGTFDELFEALTLIQTGKMQPVPVVLFGAEFWQRAVDFDFLIAEGVIAADDRNLFTFVETAEQAVAVLHDFYHGKPPE